MLGILVTYAPEETTEICTYIYIEGSLSFYYY
jgi:hypothetical protein